MTTVEPAITPHVDIDVTIRESHKWRCPCGSTYVAGTDRPDPVVFGAWVKAHKDHEGGGRG